MRLLVEGRRDRERQGTQTVTAASEEEAGEAAHAYLEAGEEQGLIEGDERRLLQSIVDFGDTLVREVMTPRPDIVAIQADATLDELRALFREQEYSRIPVYKENLDNILGIVFVKDLIQLTGAPGETHGDCGSGATGGVRAGDQAGPRDAQGIPAQAGPDGDRRRRVRRHRGPGDARRSARGDRRRDSRRVRRREYIYLKRKEAIDQIVSVAVSKSNAHKIPLTEKMDEIVTNRILGMPIFLLIMYFMFMLTFDWLGTPLSDLLDSFFSGPFTFWIKSLLSFMPLPLSMILLSMVLLQVLVECLFLFRKFLFYSFLFHFLRIQVIWREWHLLWTG